jgi:hypothetical protein
MLTFDVILETMVWEVMIDNESYGAGWNFVKGAYLPQYLKDHQNDNPVYKPQNWSCQPSNLFEFFRAWLHYLVTNNIDYPYNEECITALEEFYKKWVKNPNAYAPEMLPVICSLRAVIEQNINAKQKISIFNCIDNFIMGTYSAHIWRKALDRLEGKYFDVVNIESDSRTISVTIQSMDLTRCRDLKVVADLFSMESD